MRSLLLAVLAACLLVPASAKAGAAFDYVWEFSGSVYRVEEAAGPDVTRAPAVAVGDPVTARVSALYTTDPLFRSGDTITYRSAAFTAFGDAWTEVAGYVFGIEEPDAEISFNWRTGELLVLEQVGYDGSFEWAFSWSVTGDWIQQVANSDWNTHPSHWYHYSWTQELVQAPVWVVPEPEVGLLLAAPALFAGWLARRRGRRGRRKAP